MQESRLRETSHITSGALWNGLSIVSNPIILMKCLEVTTLNVSVSFEYEAQNSSQLSDAKATKMSIIRNLFLKKNLLILSTDMMELVRRN